MTWASHGAMDVAETLHRLFRNGALDYCRDGEVNRWLDVARIPMTERCALWVIQMR